MNTRKVNAKQCKMVAHRGCSGLEKENTLAAFIAAGNRSYWGVETDVHRTADGEYVVIHDSETGRVAGDNIVIENTSFEYIRSLRLKDIDGTFIATVAVAYVPVAFVVFAEHIADHKNLSSIIEQDLLEDPGLHRTLLGDGVGSIAGAIFGGCPNTTYGESVGCVAITGNASVSTIFAAAIGTMIASFFSPLVAFIESIPSCVMGGVCITLYGFIAVSGLKMIQKVDLEENHNLFVVSAILIAGIGGLTVTFGKVTLTSIACALILGIVTNLVLGGRKQSK